ncbi:AgrD family cyclic lactone autoinducer peptide [Hathewaya histolytica]
MKLKIKNKQASLLNILGAFLIFFSMSSNGKSCFVFFGEPEPPRCLLDK